MTTILNTGASPVAGRTAVALRHMPAIALMLAASIAPAQVAMAAGQPAALAPSVLTQRYDQARSGANIHEQILNPANVAGGSFGKLDSICVDGNIFAQPLILKDTGAGGRAKSILVIATARNEVYAYDLATKQALWQVNLGQPVTSEDIETAGRKTGLRTANWIYRDVYPDIGSSRRR